MNEFTNASEAVLEQLYERKDLLSKIIASYAAKAAKKDFWYYWNINAKEHYIRKAKKIKDAIFEVEESNKALAMAMEAHNAEIQRRKDQAVEAEKALNTCGDANNSCEGQTKCCD